MARRTRCTPTTYADVLQAVAEGNYLTVACALHGLNYDTARKWVELGAAETTRREAGMTPTQRRDSHLPSATSQEPYVAFFAAYEKARAQAEHRHVRNVERIAMGGQVIERREEVAPDGTKVKTEKVALGDWRASMTYLERVHTRRWGRRQTVEVTGADGGPVQLQSSEGARIAARLEDFLARVRHTDAAEAAAPRVIDGELVQPAIEGGTDP